MNATWSLYRWATAVLAGGLLMGAGLVGLEAGPRKEPSSLRYQRTYEDAMLEARLRGVPIWFSRHKDG